MSSEEQKLLVRRVEARGKLAASLKERRVAWEDAVARAEEAREEARGKLAASLKERRVAWEDAVARAEEAREEARGKLAASLKERRVAWEDAVARAEEAREEAKAAEVAWKWAVVKALREDWTEAEIARAEGSEGVEDQEPEPGG